MCYICSGPIFWHTSNSDVNFQIILTWYGNAFKSTWYICPCIPVATRWIGKVASVAFPRAFRAPNTSRNTFCGDTSAGREYIVYWTGHLGAGSVSALSLPRCSPVSGLCSPEPEQTAGRSGKFLFVSRYSMSHQEIGEGSAFAFQSNCCNTLVMHDHLTTLWFSSCQ